MCNTHHLSPPNDQQNLSKDAADGLQQEKQLFRWIIFNVFVVSSLRHSC